MYIYLRIRVGTTVNKRFSVATSDLELADKHTARYAVRTDSCEYKGAEILKPGSQ